MHLIGHATTFPYFKIATTFRPSSLAAFEAAIRGNVGASAGEVLRLRPRATSVAPAQRSSNDIEISIGASPDELRAIEGLVRTQYIAKGYRCDGPTEPLDVAEQGRPTLPIMARANGRLLGTMTLGIDSPVGLHADDANREHIDRLRAQGRRVGEMVKFAVSRGCDSMLVIAALVAAAHGQWVGHGLSDVLIEVHPRHAAFYQRALCFTVIGEENICPRVSAPAVLLRLNVADLTRKIAMLERALAQSEHSPAPDSPRRPRAAASLAA
jgi:hypothetical protein